ncbi:MAG: class I SAM-dependent methyltransferase [Bacteroidales bacterium]|nr:class I SAM-dependent methyltransferase [Bacteroidales bacterium]MDD4217915.1 class I SAM-dependent methyltransferase [Bacteroidales bacterium]MDY0143046.1 class I SAM-dependent methyltransferase [Bacteroidales bacterium]
MKDKNVKEYYEKEARCYDNEFYISEGKYPTLRYRHNYILKMISEIDIDDNAKILDVGCGPGEMVKDLVQLNRKVYGIDIAKEMVQIANERIKKESINLAQVNIAEGDIENLNFDDDFFDVIICSGVVEYLKDDVTWLSEIKRTLKTNGYLIINVTNKYSVRRWTTSIIEKIKSSKFFYGIMNFFKETILRKGKLHHFPFKPRVHSPNKFDKYMTENNFKKIKHNYFDFAICPAPTDTIFSFISIPLRKYMEKFSERNMIFNGTGYIVLFKKV